MLGCAAALVFSTAVASADPPAPQPDPHLPDLADNYCPGAQWTFGGQWVDNNGNGQHQVCDGVLYPDGSYWHEWTWDHGFYGKEWHHDCVSGSSAFPAPPPPGGCDGAIPPAPPAS